MQCAPGRELIRQAFSHTEGERIPVFDVANNPQLFRETLGYDNRWSDGAAAVSCAKELGLDAAMVPAGSYTGLIKREREWEGDTFFRDRFGVGYRVSGTSWPLGIAVDEVPLNLEFAERFPRMAVIRESDIAPVREGIAAAHSNDSDEIALFAGVRSGFSHLTISGGLVALSMLIYEDPDLLHELVRLSTEYWTETGLRLIEAGADALYVANDMGMNGATLISPEHLREFFLPEFFRQCETWKRAGGRVILHSCGNIMAVLPDLAAGGYIDGINNLQSHAGMDIAAVKRAYGAIWTLIGNVDATTVMTSERREDIDEALVSLIRRAGHGGGLILATDHSFHMGIPTVNVRHFIRQAKFFGSGEQRSILVQQAGKE